MQSQRALEGSTSEELRTAYLRHVAVPHTRNVFDRSPDARSVMIVVAQYWSDEAVDAVTIEHVVSPLPQPTWPEIYRDNPFYAEEDDLPPDPSGCVRYCETRLGERVLGGEGDTYWGGGYPRLDDNGAAITAFAAYVEEPGDQERPFTANGSPYALLRRGEGGSVEVDIIGKLHRPAWEDRFDVGFGIDDRAVALARLDGDWSRDPAPRISPADELAARRAAGAQGADGAAPRRSFLARLFGRR